MTIFKQATFSLIISLILASCGQKPQTTFKDAEFFNQYSLRIPSKLNQTKDGSWTTSTSERELLILEITSTEVGEKQLKEHLSELVNEDTREVNQNKTLVGSESLSVSGLTGFAEYYKKDNNKGGFPVLSYYTFAVLQDGDDIIRISSVSLGNDYTDDIKSAINSIRKIKNDHPETSPAKNYENKAPRIDPDKARLNGFQVFEVDNFIIKCDCQLEENKVALEMAKNQGIHYPMSSYVCAENEDSYETGVICNIQITDITSDYSNVSKAQESDFTNQYLDGYIGNLVANNFKYAVGTLDGVKSVEYSFDQMGMPAKAIVFVRDKKSYLLQISTRKGLERKFENLKSSFKFIS